jgi:hypothetical protein
MLRTQWRVEGMSGLWLGPAIVGLGLVLFGVLIFLRPQFLAYLVASAFVLAGLSALGVAWRMRSSVQIRPFHIDDERD